MGLPCAICGRPIHYDEPSDAKHPLSFVIDERVPVSRYIEGGFYNPTHAALDPDNVQPAHWICNARKGAKTMGEILTQGNRTKNAPDHGQIQHIIPTVVNLPDGNW